jgi:hypothetical protein
MFRFFFFLMFLPSLKLYYASLGKYHLKYR